MKKEAGLRTGRGVTSSVGAAPTRSLERGVSPSERGETRTPRTRSAPHRTRRGRGGAAAVGPGRGGRVAPGGRGCQWPARAPGWPAAARAWRGGPPRPRTCSAAGPARRARTPPRGVAVAPEALYLSIGHLGPITCELLCKKTLASTKVGGSHGAKSHGDRIFNEKPVRASRRLEWVAKPVTSKTDIQEPRRSGAGRVSSWLGLFGGLGIWIAFTPLAGWL